MKFNSQIKHKTKPKLLHLLLSLILTISMTLPIFVSQPLKAYAADGDMGAEDGGGGTGVYDGGPLSSRTGWIFYCIDLSNNQVTPTAATTSSGPITDKNGNRLPSSNISLTSRYGVTASNLDIGSDWGPPHTEGGEGRGDEVKDFMLSSGEGGQKKAYNLINRAFGQSYAEQWNNREVYLVFEPFYWYNALAGSGKQIGWYCMTSYKWGAFHKSIGCPETGMSYFKRYTNKVWPTCVKLDGSAETAALGYSAVSGAQTNTAMATKTVGAGIGIVWNDDNDSQTTCDEPKQPEPHEPPNESTGVYHIVKSYRIKNLDTNVLTDKGTFVKADSSPKISIEDESEYKLIAWKTSTTYNPSIVSTKWESTVPAVHKQSGTTPTTIEMKAPETTLYLLLEKPENDPTPATGKADFVMSQSTITRKIKLSYPDNNGITIMKDTLFKWISPAHKNSCSHTHNWSCGGCKTHSDGSSYCGGHSHTLSCSWGKWTDNSVTFSLKNSEKSNYPDIVATKAGWENVTTTGLSAYTKRYSSGTRSIVGSSSFSIKDWDYSCVLLRGKDKLTVASWKNTDLGTAAANTDLASVSSSGFSIGNSATGNRKKTTYYDSFVAKFADDSSDLKTTYSTTAGISCHGGNNCGENSRYYSLTPNPFLTLNVGVKVETYSGSDSGGTIDSSCNSSPTSYSPFSGLSVLSNKNMVRGIEVPSGANLSFRPYVQMNYDVQTATHEPYSSSTTAHKTAYVLGDIQRGMAPNDYAEVSWKSRNSDSPNLTLNSLQWSTHASAVDFISNKLGAGNLSKFTVLPGGATLDLTIKESDRQIVQATTYQCVVDGSGKTQIDNAGGSYTGLTTADAESSHQAYVSSVIDGLEKLNVEQWVTNNLSGINSGNIDSSSTDVWNISGSSMVAWGENLKAAGHSNQTASMEYKYYFSADGERLEAPASEGDLDVQEKGTTTKKYTFFTNTYGEIRYTVDDVNPNTGSNERKGNLANDSIANQINQRTHVVDKLRAAVEQGTGNDASGRSKTGTTWYNEAFDGITVYVQTTELSVGYIDPPQRSTVLDPKLTQTQTSHSDMFNEDKYNMSQYRTKEYSDAYYVTDVVGTFKGTEVYMKEMSQLFFSRKFFIPNATVDDLH